MFKLVCVPQRLAGSRAEACFIVWCPYGIARCLESESVCSTAALSAGGEREGGRL